MIRDFETNRLLLDLDNPNERVIFLKGGDGGRGNIHFKSSVRRRLELPKAAGKVLN